MSYRLALDLGTNSIGWCVLKLNEQGTPAEITRSGVRIFKDGRNPKDKTSLAVARRLARQQRRRRDRYLKRRDRLVSILVSHGLLPEDKAESHKLIDVDPYELRARGLDSALTPWELGRALFHINQRRGFKSSRKVTGGEDEDKGAIKGSISRTQQEIEDSGFRTAGEYLYDRRLNSKPVRSRHRAATKDYELYFDRAMTESEVMELLKSQMRFMPEILTNECGAEILDTILHQRPLKPVDPGRCTFEPDELRAPQALPIVQEFRILQELNSLRVIMSAMSERPLTLEERDILVKKLKTQQKMTFGGMRKSLGLSRNSKFNLESEKRKFLLGDQTGSPIGNKKILGTDWLSWSPGEQEKLVVTLLEAPDDETLFGTLCDQFGLSSDNAWSLIGLNLPEGYSRLGRTAVGRITEQLRADVIVYSEACSRAGYNHSDFYSGEFHPHLPYYGEVIERRIMPGTGDLDDPLETRIGRISNPTVHIALNQVRKVVNELIDHFGHPDEIHVEVTRDLKISKDRKRELEQQQKSNQDRNEGHVAKLDDLGLPNNYDNRLRLRLWEELNQENPLDRRCPYSGEQISINMLFSPQVEIEHLLPFARSLDDSIANKSVCIRTANKYKGNQSPYEAFGDSRDGYDWLVILDRASQLPGNKSWRFSPDAMERLAEGEDFLARHLNDTAYISKVCREYLSAICPPKFILAIPGRLTGLLRHHWGLNNILSDSGLKERTNHCHHAIDAIVVGFTDRSTLQRISRANSQDYPDSSVTEAPEPFDDFREIVSSSVSKIAISHRPDHGVNAQLHNDTAYGLVGEINGKPSVVSRKPLASFTTPKQVGTIRDAYLREAVQQATKGLSGKEFRDALNNFSEETGTKRVRVVEHLKVIPISNREGEVYKAYKGDANYCMEVFMGDKGRWKGDVITRFQANQSSYRKFMRDHDLFHKTTFSGEPLVMRLNVDDTIAIGIEENRDLFRLVKMGVSGSLTFAKISEGGALKSRDADKGDPFKYLNKMPGSLQKAGARKVFITPIGFVFDPLAK